MLDDLIKLGYIEQMLGNQAMGYRTRIKATEKLISTCANWNIEHIYRADDVPEDEIIILKDLDGVYLDYTDNVLTHMWRKKLALINARLEESVITVPGVKVDTSKKQIHRVFNDGCWTKGGRFYGGFWQLLKQRKLEQRSLIRIDDEPCCELDFKATHPSMVYNMQGIAAPADSYLIDGLDRDNVVKPAFLVLFNCESREHSLRAMRFTKHIKQSEMVLSAIEETHPAIRGMFHSREMGLQLQQLDSLIASGVLDDMYKKGIICLPIHDSFIVKAKHEQVLHDSMTKWWKYHFNQTPIIDKKY